MFKLNSTEFEIDEELSRFYVFVNENQFIQFAVEIDSKDGEYNGESCLIALNINTFDTTKTEVRGLIGVEVAVSSIEECDKREDMFYLFEHEPPVEYTLRILDICEGKAHIQCFGTAVTDGYAART